MNPYTPTPIMPTLKPVVLKGKRYWAMQHITGLRLIERP